jgi:hypothetical protein
MPPYQRHEEHPVCHGGHEEEVGALSCSWPLPGRRSPHRRPARSFGPASSRNSSLISSHEPRRVRIVDITWNAHELQTRPPTRSSVGTHRAEDCNPVPPGVQGTPPLRTQRIRVGSCDWPGGLAWTSAGGVDLPQVQSQRWKQSSRPSSLARKVSREPAWHGQDVVPRQHVAASNAALRCWLSALARRLRAGARACATPPPRRCSRMRTAALRFAAAEDEGD